MVISLRPGKFYGSSLPRPRFYTDVKFSDERVDPPVSVLDPLMSWAEEAHWSMGGLSFNRLRLQGKIEGNVKRLKKEREVSWNKKMEHSTPMSHSKKGFGIGVRKGGSRADSPPPAPISKKRRQRKTFEVEDEVEDEEEDEDEDEDEIEIEIKKKVSKNGGMKKRRRLVRKLGDDFELVGVETGRTPSKDLSKEGVRGVAGRTRGRRSMVLMDEEEEEGTRNDDGGKTLSKGKMAKAEKNSVTPTNNGKKGSASPPSGSRSSPRLKRKMN
ncbi:Auxin transport protein BIG [Bienertia sinuspersici]